MSKIVFMGLKNWFIHKLWECSIAKHLELNDHDVSTYTYTKMFGGDDLNTGRRFEHIHKHIASKTGEYVPGMLALKNVKRIEDLFDQTTLNNTEGILMGAGYREMKSLEYKGIEVGKACRNSTVRQAHSTNEDSDSYKSFFEDNVSTSIYMIDAFEKMIEIEKPDVVFCMNGIMFLENILVTMCNKRGIRVVTYERGAKPNTLYLTAGEAVNDFTFQSRFKKDLELSKKELDETLKYLEDRRTSKNTTQKFQDLGSDNLESVKKILEFDKIKDKRIVSLFTNVMWDTAAIDRDTIFDNVLDWSLKTIEHVKNNPDLHLFVRIHPADSRYWNVPGATQLKDEIVKAVKKLPSNVTLIESENPVNSYCLAELSNVCITYTSQIGSEIAAMGIPLVVAGDAFYGKLGIGSMPKDQVEYFEFINGSKKPFNNKEEALRFEHYLYFKNTYPFSLIQEDSSKGMGVVTNVGYLKEIEGTGKVLDATKLKEDKELEHITNFIFEGIKDEFDVGMVELK